MHDRQPGAPGQYKAVISAAELLKMQNGEAFTITMTRDDQPIVEGTPYSKEAVLPDDLAEVICPDVTDPTPADALRALQTGKAPASHVEDKSNPHGVTAEQVGAAPAGAGLGMTASSMTAIGDCNSAIHNGWYYVVDTTANGPGVKGIMRVEGQSSANTMQTVYSGTTTGYGFAILRREKFSGTWGVWEWVNPPMVLGTEYRTTERWGGAAVYTKLIDCGTIPASGRTVVAHNLGSRIIRMAGSTSNGNTMPYRDPEDGAAGFGNGYVDLASSANNLIISSKLSSGTSPGTGRVQLWYVKE